MRLAKPAMTGPSRRPSLVHRLVDGGSGVAARDASVIAAELAAGVAHLCSTARAHVGYAAGARGALQVRESIVLRGRVFEVRLSTCLVDFFFFFFCPTITRGARSPLPHGFGSARFRKLSRRFFRLSAGLAIFFASIPPAPSCAVRTRLRLF